MLEDVLPYGPRELAFEGNDGVLGARMQRHQHRAEREHLPRVGALARAERLIFEARLATRCERQRERELERLEEEQVSALASLEHASLRVVEEVEAGMASAFERARSAAL